jgi:hypothetical protein
MKLQKAEGCRTCQSFRRGKQLLDYTLLTRIKDSGGDGFGDTNLMREYAFPEARQKTASLLDSGPREGAVPIRKLVEIIRSSGRQSPWSMASP